MRKFVAWVSIIVFGLMAVYIITRRDSNSQPQFVTFTLPKAYAITYPKGWLREGGRQKSGFEILAIYNYDYRNVTNPDGSFEPGQIKIALSIVDKGFKPLTRIIDEQYAGADRDFTQEVLKLGERQAIRVSGNFAANGDISSKIETYLDYNDHQYAMLVGYYNGDTATAKIIETVQASFEVLK